MLLIAVVGAISSYCEKYLTTSVGQWVAHDLRRMLYQHIQRLSLAEHGESRTGDLITRVTSDIDAVQDFITSALLGIVINVLTLVGMIGVMFYLNWRFTLIALSVAPVLFLVVYFYTRRIKKASRAVKKKESELLSGVAEVLTSIQVVQAFAREDYEERRFDSESRQNVAAGLQARSIKAKLSPMVDVIVAIGTCLVLGYGARLVLRRRADHRRADRLPAVSGEDVQADARPVEDDQHGVEGGVGFERIQEVLDIESRVARPAGRARRRRRSRARSSSTTSSFSYDGEHQILEGRQLHDRAGPGRGDRRAVRHRQDDDRQPDPALLRSRSPGTIKIDGTDIREFTLKSLRDQISFVLQDTLLFRGTIWENIAYGKPDAEIRGHDPRRRAGQRARVHHQDAATATTRWSASAASRSPAASASASPSRGRSSATRRS